MAILPMRLSVWLSLLLASDAYVISDISTSSVDEGRALEIKAETFWKSLLDATDDMNLQRHAALYVDADKVIAALPAENDYVRDTLTEALMRLRRADEVLMSQAARSAQVAADALATPLGGGDFFSFITGGQGFFAQAIKSFVDDTRYPQRLRKQVQDRQADILPVLQSASDVTGNVLKDSRLASSLSFDVMKYDIYNKGVPKTPQDAKDIANRIVDAAGESRKHFTGFITEAANSIARDVESADESPATTVVRSSLQSLGATNLKGSVQDPEFRAAADLLVTTI